MRAVVVTTQHDQGSVFGQADKLLCAQRNIVQIAVVFFEFRLLGSLASYYSTIKYLFAFQTRSRAMS